MSRRQAGGHVDRQAGRRACRQAGIIGAGVTGRCTVCVVTDQAGGRVPKDDCRGSIQAG
jgi:hypothetical protein